MAPAPCAKFHCSERPQRTSHTTYQVCAEWLVCTTTRGLWIHLAFFCLICNSLATNPLFTISLIRPTPTFIKILCQFAPSDATNHMNHITGTCSKQMAVEFNFVLPSAIKCSQSTRMWWDSGQTHDIGTHVLSILMRQMRSLNNNRRRSFCSTTAPRKSYV